jgi:hypothetical protein
MTPLKLNSEKSKFQNTEYIQFIRKIRIYTVYSAYIYVDGNPIYGLGQPYTYQ